MIKYKKYAFSILEGEHWWGGASFDGVKMPFGRETEYSRGLDPNTTMNQAAPLLVSDAGRYIWSERGFDIRVAGGNIELYSAKGAPRLYEGFGTLRGAYLAACAAHFPPAGKRPPDEFFSKPQFNTWIELNYDQEQGAIEKYAAAIKEAGYDCGVFMIDCGWSPYYGKWKFDPAKIPDPKGLIDRLHGLGYKVLLWSCPFISADTPEYRALRDKRLLVEKRDGTPALLQWWDGFSAVLDLTDPAARRWYLAQNRELMRRCGADGFKMDAGDAYFYSEEHFTAQAADGNRHSELWAKLALHYEYNELRAAWKCGGLPIVQRLCDKLHSWGYNGVASLVPCALAQGIVGSAYSCPDMIGGGDYLDFSKERLKHVDGELFVRYAQSAALMPMMQFSAPPWRVLGKEENAACLAAAKLHEAFAPYILSLADESAHTGEPIIRYMEYVFPREGLAEVTDQFMLGDRYLVAPVQQKGERARRVLLPRGRWKYCGGQIFEGGEVTVDAPLDVLPYFERL